MDPNDSKEFKICQRVQIDVKSSRQVGTGSNRSKKILIDPNSSKAGLKIDFEFLGKYGEDVVKEVFRSEAWKWEK